MSERPKLQKRLSERALWPNKLRAMLKESCRRAGSGALAEHYRDLLT